MTLSLHMSVNSTIYSSFPKCGSPFLDACNAGDCSAVLTMMSAGKVQDINERGKFGRTGLFLSCRGGHINIVKTLLSSGADLEQKNDHGFTALYCAALHNQVEVLEYLIVKGADKDSTDLGGLTPLHIAAEKGHPMIVAILLKHGADKTLQDSIGHTPLSWAILKERSECITLLE